jgi:hypothetical protein
VTQHHRFLLREWIDHLEFVESKMIKLEKEIAVAWRHSRIKLTGYVKFRV